MQGFTLTGHSGVDFQQSVTTIGSRVHVNTPVLTVHNGKIFSTSVQSLSITADAGVPVVDLRGSDTVQGGLIMAKGTPTITHAPDVEIYQSNNGSRVEVHGYNFGYSNSEIIVNFDQTINPGVFVSNAQKQPTQTTDTLLVIDFNSNTSGFTGYLRARVERARVPSDNAILGTFVPCPRDSTGACNMTEIIPVINFDNSELSSSAPQWSINGRKFGNDYSNTRVYVSIPPDRDSTYLYPGWQRSGTPYATNYGDSSITFPIYHDFHPTIYGLTDAHIGPLIIVVAVKGIRSLDTYSANITGADLSHPFTGLCSSSAYTTYGYCGTQVANIILKANIHAMYTTTARSQGLNRIEIHGDNFGLEGPSAIFVHFASNFTPAEASVILPAPTVNSTTFQVQLLTVTDSLAVVDIPEDTRHGTHHLIAMVTRKGGPSIPRVVGVWSPEISRPVITETDKERVASATTLPIHGSNFESLHGDAKVYLSATAGIDGEHLAQVRVANYSSSGFMMEHITGLKDVTNSGPLRLIMTVQTVKSMLTTVATIIQIPIILSTPGQKVSAAYTLVALPQTLQIPQGRLTICTRVSGRWFL